MLFNKQRMLFNIFHLQFLSTLLIFNCRVSGFRRFTCLFHLQVTRLKMSEGGSTARAETQVACMVVVMVIGLPAHLAALCCICTVCDLRPEPLHWPGDRHRSHVSGQEQHSFQPRNLHIHEQTGESVPSRSVDYLVLVLGKQNTAYSDSDHQLVKRERFMSWTEHIR